MKKPQWKRQWNSVTFRQGWGVFFNADTRAHEIMRYDEDPREQFPDDWSAIMFVLQNAKRSKICRAAIRLCYGF